MKFGVAEFTLSKKKIGVIEFSRTEFRVTESILCK